MLVTVYTGSLSREYAANLPRNLDIWATKTATIRVKPEFSDGFTVTPFKFTTKQPPPGILLASKESRAIGLESYYLRFGIFDLEMAHPESHRITPNHNPDTLNLDVPPTIWRNFYADRVCLMGPYEEDAHLSMRRAYGPPSCVVSLYVKPSDLHLPGPLDKIPDYADEFHEEILLYYCEQETSILRSFDFIHLPEDLAETKEW